MEAEATLGEVIPEGSMAAGYPLQVASSGLLRKGETSDLAISATSSSRDA
jgi:hypothetical protein